MRGTASIRLVLKDRAPLIVDFAQPAASVSSIKANGQAVAVRSEHGHLVVPPESLTRGENIVDIAFTAGDEALNRHEEFSIRCSCRRARRRRFHASISPT